MKTALDVTSVQVLQTISPLELAMEAKQRMERNRISALLVFEGDRFCGIITMTDIASAYGGQGGHRVGELMTKKDKVVTVKSNMGLGVCAAILRAAEKHFHHLVVINDDGKVIGILSSIDLMEE